MGRSDSVVGRQQCDSGYAKRLPRSWNQAKHWCLTVVRDSGLTYNFGRNRWKKAAYALIFSDCMCYSESHCLANLLGVSLSFISKLYCL